jgi:hypothetical protein
VNTRIHESDRNKPGGPAEEAANPDLATLRELVGGMIAGGIDPAEVARQVVAAIRADRFWIRTHPAMEAGVEERCKAIIAGDAPPLMVPTDIK